MSAIALPSMMSGLFPGEAKERDTAASSSTRPHDTAAGDEELMRRYRSGDADAFVHLYRRHGDRLHRFVRRMVSDWAEVDEVFQEIWIAVICGKDRYVSGSGFTTWLFTIAHHRAVERRRARSPFARVDSVDPNEVELVDDGNPDPGDFMHRADVSQALLDAIAQLPWLQREAFLLRAEEEMSIEQIALVTGVGHDTAKSRLRYAYTRLRKSLETWR